MKPFTVVVCEQRSTAWFAARLGRVTSSSANDMLTKGKNGAEAAGRRNLRVRLALERITGKPLDRDFQSQAMKDGIDREADAYAAYEALTGEMLSRTGFLMHSTLQAGCSLDGHVGHFDGIVEIKSPIHATHLDYVMSGKVPTEYLRQLTHALFVSGAEWCDWLSYQPDFPDHLRVKLVRVHRNDLDLVGYERELVTFLEEVNRDVQAIQTVTNPAGQLRAALETA